MREFLVSFRFETRKAEGFGNLVIERSGKLTAEVMRAIEKRIMESNGFNACVIMSITELEVE